MVAEAKSRFFSPPNSLFVSESACSYSQPLRCHQLPPVAFLSPKLPTSGHAAPFPRAQHLRSCLTEGRRPHCHYIRDLHTLRCLSSRSLCQGTLPSPQYSPAQASHWHVHPRQPGGLPENQRTPRIHPLLPGGHPGPRDHRCPQLSDPPRAAAADPAWTPTSPKATPQDTPPHTPETL